MERIADVLAGKTQWAVVQGNCLELLRLIPDNSIHCIVTSPPYWGLRDYKILPSIWGGDRNCNHSWLKTPPRRTRSEDEKISPASKQATSTGAHYNLYPTQTCKLCGAWLGVLGAERTPERYVANMVEICQEIKRVLRPDGSFWLNLGDSYSTHTGKSANAGQFGRGIIEGFDDVFRNNKRNPEFTLPEKNLCMIPARTAIALQENGWHVRSEIVWIKKSPMPEPVIDRPAKSTERIYLLTKSPRYFYDTEAVKQPLAEATIQDGRAERGQRGTTGEYAAADGNCGFNSAGRHLRDAWILGPEPFTGSHHAVFPSAIPQTAILAGTSETGCCPSCGKPWQRIVNTPMIPNEIRNRSDDTKMSFHTRQLGGGQNLQDWRNANPSRTIGWKQACKCPTHEPVPAIVLDTFSGAGTTGMVALRLGRRFIGLELSENFAKMSRERIQNDCPLFNMTG